MRHVQIETGTLIKWDIALKPCFINRNTWNQDLSHILIHKTT